LYDVEGFATSGKNGTSTNAPPPVILVVRKISKSPAYELKYSGGNEDANRLTLLEESVIECCQKVLPNLSITTT
jgi:hypothetical protein